MGTACLLGMGPTPNGPTRPASACADPTLVAALPVLSHTTSLHASALLAAPSGIAPHASAPAWQTYQPNWISTVQAAFARMPALRALSAVIDLSRDLPTNAFVRAHAPTPPAPWTAPLSRLERLALSISPPPQHASADPLFLAPLRRLSALALTYGTPGLEVDCPFTVARVREITALPALRHLALTMVNHGFEQAAADALAGASRLTALELLRCVPAVPMSFLDFHVGVRFLPALRHLRRLKLNDARFICQGPAVSWAPLSALRRLETLAISGAPRPSALSALWARVVLAPWLARF